MWKRYLLYLGRWQLSTPILTLVISVMAFAGNWVASIVANLIGGLIFFWVDRFIFTSDRIGPVWQIREDVSCVDCGKVARGYRLMKSKNYDRSFSTPEFRCETCSMKKSEELKKRGIRL